jgi:hypothetical protein
MYVTKPRSLAALAAAVAFAASLPAAAQSGAHPPMILYTDIVSGPNSGGEDNRGAYLSIFGKYFGRSGLGKAVKVYIGNFEVASYRYLGPSRGRPDVEQISVQIGRIGNPLSGVPLPVEVTVNGTPSNTDRTFTVNPGRILFIDNVHGNDRTARAGDIHRPFRHVQTPDLSEGAWGEARPGDIMVMRGTGRPWTDVGFEHYFMRYRNKSGTAPTGHPGSGPIALMGYPGEDVYIRGTLADGMTGGCISAINGESFPGIGQWAVIADLRIDCEGYDGPISEEIHGNHWRVVNNDLSASTAPTSGPNVPRMAGITGNGYDSRWLGNHIHDIQGSPQESHGIYIDGDGSYEIAYNLIENIRSGNGFQIYANGSNGSDTASNVWFHHNLIHDVSKHGINIADGAKNSIVIYDNIVYRTACSGIRFNTVDLRGAQVYDNTFYGTDTLRNPHCAAISNDWNLKPQALDLRNNIFEPADDTAYVGGSVGFASFPGTAADNLFFAGSGPTVGEPARSADPGFADPAHGNFHLRRGSPAIGAGAALPSPALQWDYDLNPRAGERSDIGALAY